MPIQKSGARELRWCDLRVRFTEMKMRQLVAAGKKVHVIWDVDNVLASGRSDDVFSLLGFDVGKYFTYEERLIAQRLETGPWFSLAMKCGGLQHSQDIVTARSSYLALRVTFFLLSWRLPSRWQLFVGHQSKAESYRIILQSFAKKPDYHVFMIDDGPKHVEAFKAVAAELGMAERCHGVLAPHIRLYDEEELKREIEAVFSKDSGPPFRACAKENWIEDDVWKIGRHIQVVPDPCAFLGNLFWRADHATDVRATVDAHRPALQKFAAEVMPGRTPCDHDLFYLYELVGEP